MRHTLAALAFLGLTQIASAETASDRCEKLEGPTAQAAASAMGFLRSLEGADLRPLADKMSGKLRASVDETIAAREKLLPAYKAYARSLEDFAYQLKVCARR